MTPQLLHTQNLACKARSGFTFVYTTLLILRHRVRDLAPISCSSPSSCVSHICIVTAASYTAGQELRAANQLHLLEGSLKWESSWCCTQGHKPVPIPGIQTKVSTWKGKLSLPQSLKCNISYGFGLEFNYRKLLVAICALKSGTCAHVLHTRQM